MRVQEKLIDVRDSFLQNSLSFFLLFSLIYTFLSFIFRFILFP